MFFDKEFIEWVEDNPVEGVVKACEKAILAQQNMIGLGPWDEQEHELLWDASTFVDLVLSEHEIIVDASLPDVSVDIGTNCENLLEYLVAVSKLLQAQSILLKIESYKNRYSTALKNSFAYEFSQGDLDRVQVLISEIRVQITESEFLDEDHKLRLLKRLEKLQLELHKRVSDLDRFWGLVGDAGVVLGKFGSDAKPIVDRIKEIASITWKTQARAEELASGTQNPMLGDSDSV